MFNIVCVIFHLKSTLPAVLAGHTIFTKFWIVRPSDMTRRLDTHVPWF